MPSEKKNVIIVGGGNAGTHTAWELSQLDKSRFNLILLNERPFYAHLPALARIAVSDLDKMADRAIFGYETLFVGGNGTAKVGKVVEVAESAPGQGGEVVLEDGERIPYAALVLATGSRWPAFMSLPKTEGETKTHIASWRDDFKAAEHVVIVGGGAVGVELAGEIKEIYPKKKVTIIHKDSMLLNDVYPAKFRKNLEKRTRAFGIDLILGDAVEGAPGKVSGVKTRDGKSIADADLVVHAFGSQPNTAPFQSLKDALNPEGRVRVNEFLEVCGHSGVFALGDIIDWPEQKQAVKAMAHSLIVAANVTSFLDGKPLKKVYKGSTEMILVPLGKQGGAGYAAVAWGLTFGGFMTKKIKGQDLFVGVSRKARGLPP